MFANTSEFQTLASKKDKRHKSCQKGHLPIRVNGTKVAKKKQEQNQRFKLYQVLDLYVKRLLCQQMSQESKKQVAVLAISTLIIEKKTKEKEFK